MPLILGSEGMGDSQMTYRVIQWATGGVGKAAIEAVLDHPDLELVGCLVYSDEKNGQDVGSFIGIDPVGVIATNDKQAIYDTQADCVVYTPQFPDERDVISILASGKSVVTSVGWVYPQGSQDTTAIEAACAEGNSALHGTGIHPGGMTERFPLMISALTRSITHVKIDEYSDIRTYNAPGVVRDMMLFGHSPENARKSPMVQFMSGGFMQSIDMVAAELGFRLDAKKRTTHDISVATAAIDSPIGIIEPGQVAAQRFIWEGLVDDEPVISAAVNWLMGEDNLEPGWGFGPEGARYEIEVVGDPTMHLNIHGCHPHTVEEGLKRNPGVVVTALHCVSAIPYLCAAGPGIKTYLDLPLISGRAAPQLQRP
jgi:2,4-diaminopentanoate dehydrogenase